jgi:hypothetical protein
VELDQDVAQLRDRVPDNSASALERGPVSALGLGEVLAGYEEVLNGTAGIKLSLDSLKPCGAGHRGAS